VGGGLGPVPGGDGRFVGAAPPAVAGGPGGLDRVDPTLLSYLERHQGGATWLVATSSASQAAPIELATGRAVLAMGGFSGSDPALTAARLGQLVRSGQLRYVLVDGGPGRFGSGGFGPDGSGGVAAAPGAVAGVTRSVTMWVTQNCTVVDYGGGASSSLYDCATAVGGSAR